jgi:hypothetical protein
MHEIYKDKKAYNIIEQISLIIYSSLISSTINVLLRQLSRSEGDILSIKAPSNIKDVLKRSKEVQNNLIIKFIIFYILGIIILFFYWFFLSCFCVVFINTQIILIKDSLISFAISMIYPFGLYLLPGFFRIPAIKSKNKECLYKFSKYLAFI